MFKFSMLLKNARFYGALTLVALALSMNSLPLKAQDMEEVAVGDTVVCLKCTINVITNTINCVKIDCPKS